MIRKTLLFAVALALPLAPSFAQNSAPGSYKDWNKVDSVTIMQSFKFADFDKLVVLPLDKSEIKLPAETDNTYAPTKKILEESETHFIDGLNKGVSDFRKGFVVEKGADATTNALKVLLVRGKIEKLGAGSQAARVFGGFGAGAGSARISIELVDAATGTVLARMKHERRVGSGGYDKVMSKSLNEVGETFGKGLKGF
jgi:hypothetical protein